MWPYLTFWTVSHWPVMSNLKQSFNMLASSQMWGDSVYEALCPIWLFPQLSALENLPAAVVFCWNQALEGSLGTLGAVHLQYGDAAPKHYPRCVRHHGLLCPQDTASEGPWIQCLSSGFMTAGLNKVSKLLSSVFILPYSPHWWKATTV